MMAQLAENDTFIERKLKVFCDEKFITAYGVLNKNTLTPVAMTTGNVQNGVISYLRHSAMTCQLQI